MLLYYFILLGPIYIGDPGSHTSHSSAYKSTYYRSWNSAIFIHHLHWIFCAEGVRRYAIVLLRKRILSEPAAEDWVVLTGSVVDVWRSELELLLLAVVAEPVAIICQACCRVPVASSLPVYQRTQVKLPSAR